MHRSVLLLLAALVPCAWADGGRTVTALTPREVFFGNPTRVQPELRPDGAQLAYIAPQNGVLNVWLTDGLDPETAHAVTHDTNRGIQGFSWAYTNRHILYSQDANGDENTHVYCLDVETGEVRDLTPLPGIQGRISGVSHKRPEEILVSINDRNPQLHDLYRVSLRTGERTLVQQNDRWLGIMADDDLEPIAGMRLEMGAKGIRILAERLPLADPPTVLLEIGAEDAMTTGPVGLDSERPVAYLIDSRGRDTAALTALNVDTGELTVLGQNRRADVSDVFADPTTNRPLAYAVNAARTEWYTLDPSVAGDLAALDARFDGDFHVSSTTLDMRLWTVAESRDDGPVRYYLWDRGRQDLRFLFSHRPELETVPLSKMTPVTVKARDGLSIPCYLTLPREAARQPERRWPTVLWIHGGPWARDEWGYNPVHQWLASRGYAVMSVNYRGSLGFGKSFVNAANGEWGGKMHEDVLDALDWMIAHGIADPKRVAITGGSYGGYETLVGVTQSADRFACGVDLCGPSNLLTFLANVPEYWMPILPLIGDRVGDPRTAEGKAKLEDRSPLNHVDLIRKPLLIGQGANDPRVKQSESDQIAAALQARNIPVTYVLYPDEGHGFARPENTLSFFAVMEAFLAQHLGGACEPVGLDFAGSSIQFAAGREDLELDMGDVHFSVDTQESGRDNFMDDDGTGAYAYPPVGGGGAR